MAGAIRGFFIVWRPTGVIHSLRAALVAALLVAPIGATAQQQAPPTTQPPTTQSPVPPPQPTGAQVPPNSAGQVPPAPGAQVPAPGAQVPPAPGAQVPPNPAAPAPAVPLTPAAAPACPAPVPPATLPARSFTTRTGLILHQVPPTRVVDFENLLAYVRQALAKTTNPTLREQAKGWQFFRVVEAGPLGDVLYAFLIDPAVPCVDYALGPILAEAYPDPAQLLEIWKLYTGSVRNGGTLLNFSPLPLQAPAAIQTPATTTPAAPGQQPPVPLDANPVTPPTAR